MGQPQKLGHGSSNRVYVNSRTARDKNNREFPAGINKVYCYCYCHWMIADEEEPPSYCQ